MLKSCEHLEAMVRNIDLSFLRLFIDMVIALLGSILGGINMTEGHRNMARQIFLVKTLLRIWLCMHPLKLEFTVQYLLLL